MEDDLDRAQDPFLTKLFADICLEIRGVAMCPQEKREALYRQERLLRAPYYAKVQSEAVKSSTSVPSHGLHVVHEDDRILADQRRVVPNEFDRSLSVQNIERVIRL
jgi:hypothetical protein